MTRTLTALVAAAMLTLAGCGTDVPEAATETETRTAPNGDEFNDADVAFASDMVPHHAEALAMVDLTLGRPLDPEVEALAEEIREAQAPEIETMVGWLIDWDEPVPETMRDHANAHGGGMDDQDLADLEASSNMEFQERWLEMMVEHHTEALEMVRAAQEDGEFGPAVELAGEIESAQEAEVEAMEQLLGS